MLGCPERSFRMKYSDTKEITIQLSHDKLYYYFCTQQQQQQRAKWQKKYERKQVRL